MAIIPIYQTKNKNQHQTSFDSRKTKRIEKILPIITPTPPIVTILKPLSEVSKPEVKFIPKKLAIVAPAAKDSVTIAVCNSKFCNLTLVEANTKVILASISDSRDASRSADSLVSSRRRSSVIEMLVFDWEERGKEREGTYSIRVVIQLFDDHL